MSIADAIPRVLAARAARDAARVADRAARDAFIVPQFAAMSARFEQLLAAALGFDARISVTVAPVVVAVQNRTFATLATRVVTVQSAIAGAPQSATFTPQLDFHETDQFGVIACAIDFSYRPRRSPRDATAATLLARGVEMRGTTIASLLLPSDDGVSPLAARDLEDAFTAWWLQ
ncbi:MAG: hypothetical protein ACREPM_25820 [Gemmatimonadaceae bacterium]